MFRVILALLVSTKQLSREEAQFLSDSLGSEPLPDTLEIAIGQVELHRQMYRDKKSQVKIKIQKEL